MVRKKILLKDKKCFGAFVRLATSEYGHLCALMGKEKTDQYITDLNLYIGSKGDQYESHYYAIMMWENRKKAALKNAEVRVDTSNQKAAGRFLEKLKGRDTMAALDYESRSAVYALMKKRNINWPLLRYRVLRDPELEEQVRREFIAEMQERLPQSH